MAQKIVSFEVAKALKEAGYPQTTRPMPCYNEKGQLLGRGGNYIRGVKYDAPTYIDAWLWLWREKGIRIEVCELDERATWSTYIKPILIEEDSGYQEPEKAIAKAINYLVKNKLLK